MQEKVSHRKAYTILVKKEDREHPKNHSGFVYVVSGEEYGIPVYEMRKPDPLEREAIIMEEIRRNGGSSFKIAWLAGKLGVTERTIQLILRDLKRKGAIFSTPAYGQDGRQTGSLYRWTGAVDPIVGAPTLKDLYHKKNTYGFRSFSWDDFKVTPGRLSNSRARVDAYYRYMELIAIKKRLLRKKKARAAEQLKILRRLKVRNSAELAL